MKKGDFTAEMYKSITEFEINQLRDNLNAILKTVKLLKNRSFKAFEKGQLAFFDMSNKYVELLNCIGKFIAETHEIMFSEICEELKIDKKLQKEIKGCSGNYNNCYLSSEVSYGEDPLFSIEFSYLLEEILEEYFHDIYKDTKVIQFMDMIPMREENDIDECFQSYVELVECTFKEEAEITDFEEETAIDIVQKLFNDDVLVVCFKNFSAESALVEIFNELVLTFEDGNTEGIYFKNNNTYLVLSDNATIIFTLEKMNLLLLILKSMKKIDNSL